MRRLKKGIAVLTAVLMAFSTSGISFAAGEVTKEIQAFHELWDRQASQNEGISKELLDTGKDSDAGMNWECYRIQMKDMLPGAFNALIISGEGSVGSFVSENKEEEVLPPWYNPMKQLSMTVYIQDGIKSIGKNAFPAPNLYGRSCSVYVPDSVTQIDEGAMSQSCLIIGAPKSEAERYASQNGNYFNAFEGSEWLKGDVDGSGQFEATDALHILKMLAGLEASYSWSADADSDGSLTASDSLFVLKTLAGME